MGTYRKAAIVGGLAAAALVAVVTGFAAIGVAAGTYGWAMYGDHSVPNADPASRFAAMEAELAAVEAERNAMLREIGVRPPGLEADIAAEVRSRAAPILERYAAVYNGGAMPDARTVDSLNAEYDALLAEFGAAPQELSAEQARAVDEIRAAEIMMLDNIERRYTTPEGAGMAAHMGTGAGKAGAGAVPAHPALDAERGLALATRLAPLEQRYEEIHAELESSRDVGALHDELFSLDELREAIIAASGGPAPGSRDAQASAPSPGGG